MRTLPIFFTVAVLALAGCTASPSGEATASATSVLGCTESGTSSDAIKVTGAVGAEPKVSFGSPLKAGKTQRTVVSNGKGKAVKTGDSVAIAYAAYNASTGKKLSAGGYGTDPGLVVSVAAGKSVIPGIIKGIACSKVGSRVAVVVPPADAFGATGNTNLGVGKTDNIVFVIDVKNTVPTRATGATQKPKDGFPTVALAGDGAPTVTVPKADAPKALQTEVLKKGTGATVAAGATVTVQYTGVIWSSGKVFDQSWGKGGPTSFPLGQVVPGFAQGLIGQTVGSQVVIVIPPKLGYGTAGNSSAGISGTDTIVFVADILASSK